MRWNITARRSRAASLGRAGHREEDELLAVLDRGAAVDEQLGHHPVGRCRDLLRHAEHVDVAEAVTGTHPRPDGGPGARSEDADGGRGRDAPALVLVGGSRSVPAWPGES